MTCDGCAAAVKRVLGRVAGVSSVETDVAAQLVVVRGTCANEPVLYALKKWGDATGKSVSAC